MKNGTRILVFFFLFIVGKATAANIAFVYNPTNSADSSHAISYHTFLESQGYTTTLVRMADVATTDFSGFLIIIIGDRSGSTSVWGDPASVTALKNTNLPIIGLGEGGYAFFGKLSLDIGWPMGSHGGGDSLAVFDPTTIFFRQPNYIPVSAGSVLHLYTSQSPWVVISTAFLSQGGFVTLGSWRPGTAEFTLITEHAKYFLWGYGDPPDSMTATGRSLFVNAIEMMRQNLLTWYPLTTTANDTTATLKPATLSNTLFQGGGVYCDGTYGSPAASYVSTPKMGTLSFGTLSISASFRASPDTAEDFRPVFIGGAGWRWIGFLLRRDGIVGMKYNNGYLLWSTVHYSANDWHDATVTYDSTLHIGKLYLDSVLIGTQDFHIISGRDSSVLTVDASVGSAFKGYIRDLKVYNSVIVPVATIPLPLQPRYDDTSSSVDQVFRWRSVSGAASYRLQVSTDSTFSGPFLVNASGIADTTYTRNILAGYTRYFWRVSTGTGAWSFVYHFTTGMPYPGSVSLLVPAAGSTVQGDTVSFVWNTTEPSVDGYRIILASDSILSTVLIDSVLIDTSIVLLLPSYAPGKTYWWTVMAHNPIGFSDGYSVRPFKTPSASSVRDRDLPLAFALDQSYPNPFNPSTTIRYELPHTAHVSLRVYNTLGQEVVTLVNEIKPAGVFLVTFDAGNLASGVYLYRLQASTFMESRKMIVVK